MEISFCELRAKEVVNLFDGKQLGHIIDMVIDTSCARVLGIVVPGEKSIFNIFKSATDIFIPYHRICKIGKDVILVDLNVAQSVKVLEEKQTPKASPHSPQLSSQDFTQMNPDINLNNTFENNQHNYPNFTDYPTNTHI